MATHTLKNMMNEPIEVDNRVITRAPETKLIPQSAFDRDSDHTTIYWLGAGGFLLNTRGTIFMLDPILETLPAEPLICENGHKMLMPFPLHTEDIMRCDMLLYTHDDGDHASPSMARKLSQRGVPMLGPARVFETLVKKGMKPDLFMIGHAGEEYTVNDVKIKLLPADHQWQLIDEETLGRAFYPEDCLGYVVNTQDGGILFTGDTRLLREHLEIPDIVVLPLDTSKCTFHLSRPAATLLANKYPNAHLIPYHYGTFDQPEIPAQEDGDPQQVLCNVNGADWRARILGPGHPFAFREGKEIV